MIDWKQRLVAGYREFRAGDYRAQKRLYEDLGTNGQSPKVMLIACADSRVDPTDIFNAYPGQMFVARNVANIVPPPDAHEGYHGTTAAIEYAVKVLKVEMIVIMGHESCGGIQGCINGLGHDPNGGYVGKWVSLLNGVHERLKTRDLSEEDMQFQMELETVRTSIDNLMQFDFIQEAVSSGQLKLQGAYFSIIKARLMMANESGAFETIEA